jgi:hypothetical protein
VIDASPRRMRLNHVLFILSFRRIKSDVPADQLVGTITEHPLGGRVHGLDDSVRPSR